LGLATCRRQLGQKEEARRLLDLLIQAQPRNALALAERGKVALEANQLAEAEDWLHRAALEDPNDRDVVYPYYQCLKQRGKDDAARGWSERLDRIKADLDRLAELTRQIIRSPRDPEPRYEAGVLLLHNGRDKEGLVWLQSALQIDPGHR